jgi:hypothetical protein
LENLQNSKQAYTLIIEMTRPFFTAFFVYPGI